MDILIKLFGMFSASAATFAKYISQNKEDVLALGKQIWGLLVNLNGLTANVLGTDIQKIINQFIGFAVKYFVIAFNLLIELIKKLATGA